MATDSSHSPTSPSTRSTIDEHPDIMSLRDRYAEVSNKPMAGLIEGLCLLTGLYLAISPWVVGFDNITSLRVTNLVVGLALAVLAMGYGSVLERTHGLGWVAIAIGVWTIIAPWVVAGDASINKTIWNNAFVGGAACLLGLATMGLGLMRRKART
ncbi:SPW repeat-containing protein [Actinacidiphila yanglinensis]|uniref:SPW repeat-containing protein n=1 Tax=Actinacidiphila yanglinensis TaxID=310779 RepID=A0A1H5YYS8_9ACTN|nr:SPW repeat protein [Actinacidiphila yanglinensis]SEG28950.1 SPW repeat-containing protein [Actinacidiphila yanglinensis]